LSPLGEVAGVSGEPAVRGALASALEAGRRGFNARLAAARRGVPGFDPERFARRFAAIAASVVDAVARRAPDRTAAVTEALFDVALEMSHGGGRGAANAAAIDAAWTAALPAADALVAAEPGRVARALGNAIAAITLVPGARPAQWIARMTAAGPRCSTIDEWLRCGLVAAWTSGLAHFRPAALDALGRLPPDPAHAVLGLQAREAAFDPAQAARLLTADPWLPPDRVESPPSARALDVVASVGGFRGLGGPFIEPPAVGTSGGRFVAFDTRSAWLLSVDVCGATFIRIEAPDLDPAAAGSTKAFEIGRGGRVTAGGATRAFPILADVSGSAASAT